MEGHLLVFAPHQVVHDVTAAGVAAAITKPPLGRVAHHEARRVTDPAVAAARGVPPTLEAAPHSAPHPLVILILKLELPAPRLPRLLDTLVDCQLGFKVVLQLGLARQSEGVVIVLALAVHSDVPEQNTDNEQCACNIVTYSDPFSSGSRKVRV